MFSGYTEATQAMVSAMRDAGVKRLVLCHSWYTEEASRSQAISRIRGQTRGGDAWRYHVYGCDSSASVAQEESG